MCNPRPSSTLSALATTCGDAIEIPNRPRSRVVVGLRLLPSVCTWSKIAHPSALLGRPTLPIVATITGAVPRDLLWLARLRRRYFSNHVSAGRNRASIDHESRAGNGPGTTDRRSLRKLSIKSA